MDCFERGIERKNTNCDKWDAPFVKEGVVPMWVADMDFEVAPAITRRLVPRGRELSGISFCRIITMTR